MVSPRHSSRTQDRSVVGRIERPSRRRTLRRPTTTCSSAIWYGSCMIAIGVRCKCGWGVTDTIPLVKATHFLRNLTFMVSQHYNTCPEVEPPPVVPSWKCSCGHTHELNDERTKRRRKCRRCECRKEQVFDDAAVGTAATR